MRRSNLTFVLTVVVSVAVCVCPAITGANPKFQVLYNFEGGKHGGRGTQTSEARPYKVLHAFTGASDGALPYAGLVRDRDGRFYGTTLRGGTGNCTDNGVMGCGVVFRMDSSGSETVLYDFTGGTDGANPFATLVIDATGNLYGTTEFGGDPVCGGCGVVFEVSSNAQETVLHSFQGEPSDGSIPRGYLIRDDAGNLYGTTWQGGTEGGGTVFRLDSTQKETVLHSFVGNTDGALPFSGLVRDAAGNLYGTTAEGGGSCACGVVFKVNHAADETVLHKFTGRRFPPQDGKTPYGGLIRDSHGNLYGTTYYGGSHVYGTVFRLSPAGKETVLHDFFPGSGDGGAPVAGLVRDVNGNLYGTTYHGGSSNMGTVFMLDKAGKETVLYNFIGGSDGAYPWAGLLRDAAGNLYGTTTQGGGTGCGGGGCGAVFMLHP